MAELKKLLDLIEEASRLHKPAGAPSADVYLERIWLQASRVRPTELKEVSHAR